ncbi:hypothetical protein AMTRI_Chr02g254590 [Amborella trichopoda]
MRGNGGGSFNPIRGLQSGNVELYLLLLNSTIPNILFFIFGFFYFFLGGVGEISVLLLQIKLTNLSIWCSGDSQSRIGKLPLENVPLRIRFSLANCLRSSLLL